MEEDPLMKHSDVWIGIMWSWTYQMGTLAMGAAIMTIVDIIRGTFEYIGDKMSGANANNGCT